MKRFIITSILSIGIFVFLQSQVPVPANEQSEPILLRGATAHLGNGNIIQNSSVGFENGVITVVSEAGSPGIDVTGYKIVDVTGKHVYPGFILVNTQLGLQEVSAIRAMSDQNEHGTINPNVRSAVAYNTDSELIPTMRFNGILLAESTPAGGMISGCSSVMEMEGWNWEDATFKADVALHLNWPNKMNRRFDFATFTVRQEDNKNYSKDVDDLERHFRDARSYGEFEDKTSNLKLEGMQGLFDGTMILMIHAGEPGEMIESVKFAQTHGVQKIVLIGGEGCLHITSFLKDNNIPVILPPVHRLPERAHHAIDLPYQLPHLLTEAGVEVSLSHSGMLSNARNLPFYAGTAVAYGMNKEEALKTITLNPARALGIADRVGSLEVGKNASLFVSEGDALDIRSSILMHAFISGKEVVLPNKQQELFERYSRKYGHIK